MSTLKIKKAFEPIVTLLESNADSIAPELLAQVKELASAKVGGGGGKATTFHRDENGEVVAIKCYYHKLWMSPQVAEFGAKKGSASGFNSMCKDGVSKWTKQKAAADKAEAAILDDIANGDLDGTAEAIQARRDEIAAEASQIIPREDGYGFETLEECLEDLANRA